MKVDGPVVSVRFLILLCCTLFIAVIIKPINFLLVQIILIGGGVFIYLLLRDVANALIVWLGCLLFVLFYKMPLGIDMPNLSIDRIMWASLFLYFLFQIITGRVSLRGRWIEMCMLLLCGWTIFSIVTMKLSFFPRNIFDAISLFLNIYLVPFSIFIIARDFVHGEQKIRKVFTFLSFVLLYLSLTAIFEHFKLTGFVFPRDIMNPDIGIHFGRARGPFLQAAINGTVLGMLSVTNIYMAMKSRLPFRLFFIAVALLAPVAIFFTYTRAAWLAMLAALTLMFFLNTNFRKYVLILVILGAAITIPLHSKIVDMKRITSRSYSMSSIYDRINLYYTYFRMLLDRPLLGFGFSNFSEYSYEYFSRERGDDPYNVAIPAIHDTFAGTLVELGGIGFIIFVTILALILRESLTLFKNAGREGFLSKDLVVAFWGVGIVYILNALFIDMKNHQFQNVIFYMLAGILLGIDEGKDLVCRGR